MTLKHAIEELRQRRELSPDLCASVMEEMLQEDANPLQTAAFLVALRAKPETPREFSAIIQSFHQRMHKVMTPHRVLDIVGTGGDGANTVNISTGAAILAASCGVKIAKHGNRAVSSQCGAADVLEALGIPLQMDPEKIASSIDRLGFGFCFSPNFHPAMQKLRQLRRELNVPTSLNLIGPLLNPARASHLILGVMEESLMPVLAELLQLLGTRRSVVVHGQGLDEISTVGPVKMLEVTPNDISASVLDPREFGFEYCEVSDLQGGEANLNAALLRAALAGERGPIADTLVLNAAMAVYLYGLAPSFAKALPLVQERLQSGAALQVLENIVRFSHA